MVGSAWAEIVERILSFIAIMVQIIRAFGADDDWSVGV
jgi:Na+-driven multidrug efflux pump